MKKIPNIPDAFKDLPDSAKLCSKDIAKIFNYKDNNCIDRSFTKGLIPEPDMYSDNKICGHNVKRAFWKLGTIRKWRELAIAESNKQ